MNPWFKFYGSEYLSDPKMLSLSASDRSCWITLLSYASVINDNGTVKHLTEEKLMIQSGLDFTDDEWNKAKGVLERFKNLEMIRIDNGVITVLNWSKRQETSLTPYERVKRFRKKQKTDNDSDNALITTEEKRVDKKRKDNIDSFELFWKEYPNKTSKKKALQVWNKIAPDQELFDRIMSALAIQKKTSQWQKDNGQFIPHPTTWLNQERWNDEGKTVEIPKEKQKVCKGCGKTVTSFIQSGGVLYCNFDCLYAKKS